MASVWASRDLQGDRSMFSKCKEEIICYFIAGWIYLKWLYLCSKAELRE